MMNLLLVIVFVLVGVTTLFNISNRQNKAEQNGAQARELLTQIDDVLREGLDSWPKMGNRIEFTRWCIQEHRRLAREPYASANAELAHVYDELNETTTMLQKRNAEYEELHRRLAEIDNHTCQCPTG